MFGVTNMSSSSSSCCVSCLLDVGQGYTCLKCNQFLCEACLVVFVRMCLDSKELPRCSNSACSHAITHSMFRKFPKLDGELFARFNGLLIDQEKRMSDSLLSKQELTRKLVMVDEQVGEAHRKMVGGLPQGLKLTFDILAKPEKLAKRIKRELVSEHTTTAITHHFLECPNEMCTGHISAASSKKCDVCAGVLCEKCMELVQSSSSTTTHICKPDLVETVLCIKASSRSCPKCHVTITRSFGCDHMWCTNCHTSFSYSSGEILHDVANPEKHVFSTTGTATSVRRHLLPPELSAERIAVLGAVFEMENINIGHPVGGAAAAAAPARLIDLPRMFASAHEGLNRLRRKNAMSRLDVMREKLHSGTMSDQEFAMQVSRSHELDLVDSLLAQVIVDFCERTVRFYRRSGRSEEDEATAETAVVVVPTDTGVSIVSDYIRITSVIHSFYAPKSRLPLF